MNLELLLGEAIAGFGIGFAAGRKIDRSIVFPYETNKYLTEMAKGFAERLSPENIHHTEEKDKGLKETFRKQFLFSEKGTYLLTALIAGTSNITAEICKVVPIGTALVGTPLTMLATYAGIRLGEYYSKISREKSELTPEERKTDDEKFNAMIDSIKRGNSESKSAFELYINFLGNLAIKKGNVQIFRDVTTRILNTVPGALSYRAFRQFLEFDEMNGMFSKAMNANADGDAELLVLHGKKIYLCIPRQMADAVPSVDTCRELDWDETVEGLLGIVDQIGQKPLVMVKGKDAPLPLKELFGAISCGEIYARREHSQHLH